MSKYQQQLIDHIKKHENFILPLYRRNEILSRLTTSPLEDLSCSRTGITWGIPVPNDSRHVMYVWFDALSSYLTGKMSACFQAFYMYYNILIRLSF
jgi:methionyl-tRNA synthetase